MAFLVTFTILNLIIMKMKQLLFAGIAIALYSCGGTKSTTPPMVEAKTVSSSSEIAEGKGLYESNCAKCHQLYAPSDFSKEQWKPIVHRMQKKAHLTDPEGLKIYNYLTAN
jgi:cytochrome c5